MGNFELEQYLYFWFCDSLQLAQDPRNLVMKEVSLVKFHRDHSNKFENGTYIAQLMKAIRKLLLQKDPHPFALSNALHHLKDQNTQPIRKINWDILATELKKFEIKLGKSKLEQLYSGKHEVIADIVQRLFQFDQRIMMMSDARNTQTKSTPSKPQVRGKRKEVLALMEQISKKFEESGNQSPTAPKLNIYSDRSSHVNIGFREYVDRSREDRDKEDDFYSVNNYHAFEHSERKQLEQASENRLLSIYDLDDAEAKASNRYPPERPEVLIDGHKTTLTFFVSTISKSLNLPESQVQALLANNHQYWALICQNGQKGGDFNQLYQWFNLVSQNILNLALLLEGEKKTPQNLRTTLNILKCGLYSKNLDVATASCECLVKLSNQVKQRFTRLRDNSDICSRIKEWFVSRPVEAQGAKSKGFIPLNKFKMPKKQSEFNQVISEPGLRALLRCLTHHKEAFEACFISTVIQIADGFLYELITVHFKAQYTEEKNYLGFMHSILKSFLGSLQGDQIQTAQDAVQFILESSLKENEVIPLISPQTVSSEQRQVSLALILEIWEVMPKVVAQGQYQDSIINILRNCCRDHQSSAIRMTSVNLLFYLLHLFAYQRNNMATVVYKALTFLLIESFADLEMRHELLQQFITTAKRYPKMPIYILFEPYIKHIKLGVDRIQNEILDLQLTDSQQQKLMSSTFSINTMDFHYMFIIAQHSSLQPDAACLLLQVVCEIAKKLIIFTRSSLAVALILLKRFSTNRQFNGASEEIIRDLCRSLLDQDTIKLALYNKARQHMPKHRLSNIKIKSTVRNTGAEGEFTPTKMFTRRLQGKESLVTDALIKQTLSVKSVNPNELQYFKSVQIQEKMIVNLMQCLLSNGSHWLTELIRHQLLETYIYIEEHLKYQNRGIEYLLSMLDPNVQELIFKQKQKIAATKRAQTLADIARRSRQNYRRNSALSPEDVGFNDRASSPRDNLLRSSNSNRSGQSPSPVRHRLRLKEMSSSPSPRIKQANRHSNHFEKRSQSTQPQTAIKKMYDQITREYEVGEATTRNKTLRATMTEALPYFDIFERDEEEATMYFEFVKENLRIYKKLFARYALGRDNGASETFDAQIGVKDFISLKQLQLFLSEFQFRKSVYKELKYVKFIINRINTDMFGDKAKSFLNLQGFIEFLLQLAVIVGQNRDRPATELVLNLFGMIKQRCQALQITALIAAFNPPDKALSPRKKSTMVSRRALTSRHHSVVARDKKSAVFSPQPEPVKSLQNHNVSQNSSQVPDQIQQFAVSQNPSHGEQSLNMLTFRVNEDPNFELPPGFTKVQIPGLEEPRWYVQRNLNADLAENLRESVPTVLALEEKQSEVAPPENESIAPLQLGITESNDTQLPRKLSTLGHQEQTHRKSRQTVRKHNTTELRKELHPTKLPEMTISPFTSVRRKNQIELERMVMKEKEVHDLYQREQTYRKRGEHLKKKMLEYKKSVVKEKLEKALLADMKNSLPIIVGKVGGDNQGSPKSIKQIQAEHKKRDKQEARDKLERQREQLQLQFQAIRQRQLDKKEQENNKELAKEKKKQQLRSQWKAESKYARHRSELPTPAPLLAGQSEVSPPLKKQPSKRRKSISQLKARPSSGKSNNSEAKKSAEVVKVEQKIKEKAPGLFSRLFAGKK